MHLVQLHADSGRHHGRGGGDGRGDLAHDASRHVQARLLTNDTSTVSVDWGALVYATSGGHLRFVLLTSHQQICYSYKTLA
jgi:hypothetical protein